MGNLFSQCKIPSPPSSSDFGRIEELNRLYAQALVNLDNRVTLTEGRVLALESFNTVQQFRAVRDHVIKTDKRKGNKV